MSDYIECSAFEVHQPVGAFYVAKIRPEDLTYITFVDVRRIEKEERDVERVLGIQRPLSPSRIKEITQYVNLSDASFPSRREKRGFQSWYMRAENTPKSERRQSIGRPASH